MQIRVDLTQEQLHALWRIATNEVIFLREEPRKAWTDKERRECIGCWLRRKANEEIQRG